MSRYLIRRLLHSGVTLLGVSILVFVVLRVIPGDPARMLLREGAPQSAVDELNRQLGLTKPIAQQYLIFLASAIRGDFGQSFQYRIPASSVLRQRAPATISLAAASIMLIIVIGVPIGMLAAVRRRTIYDYAGMSFAVLGQSLPTFWLGIMLILLFGVTVGWLPTSGFESWWHLILPSATLAAYPAAFVARLTRSAMLEVLNQDFVRTARSKGLREAVVILRHAFKNAVIPVVTIIGLQVGGLLSGAVITESVFAWPGIGRLIVDAIFSRDFPVIQAVLIVSASVFVLVNLAVDLTYSMFDPRIRYA
jgi:peptide/nickel transport system permease protein